MNDKRIKILFNLSLIVLIVLSVAAVTSSVPELQWHAAIGEGGSNEVAYSVISTPDGGFMAAGSKSTPSNGLDIYLVKTSSNGAVEWEKTYGGAADECAYSMILSSDGGYVLVGYTKSFVDSDVLMLKTDGSGEQEWLATFGGFREDVGQSVVQTAGGDYVIAGGTKSFGSGGSFFDVYLIAVNASGGMIWNKTYGGLDHDYANSVQQTADGGFIIAGGTGMLYSSAKDILVIKTDSIGNTQWTKTYGGGGADNAHSIQQTKDGGYIIAGVTSPFGSGYEDAYLIKTSPSGATIWQKYYGGSGSDSAHSVILALDGGYLFVGTTHSFGSGLNDIYLVKVDQSGNQMTTAAFGGSNDDFGYAVEGLQDGSCIIAGATRSYSGTYSLDIYLAKTNNFIDVAPPQVIPIQPTANSTTNNPADTIAVALNDDGGVDLPSVAVTLDSQDISESCTITAEGFSYLPPSPLAEGIHTMSVVSSDLNGNRGEYSWSFMVDSLPPTVYAIDPTNHESINSVGPLISASFSDPSGVNVSGIAMRLNLIDVTPSAQINSTGVQYIPGSPLGQGLHSVTLIVSDMVGNTATVSWTFRVDMVAPTISSMSPTNGATFTSFGDAKVAISASYSDNVQVAMGSIRLTLDGIDITNSANVTSTTLSCTRTVASGTHTALLTVVDAAGNISTSTVSFTVNNLLPLAIIAAIVVIAVVVLFLLLRMRRKSKVREIPDWEKPTPPPPPPTETYIPEVEREVRPKKVEEIRYTPPLPAEKPIEPPPEPRHDVEKAAEGAPMPPLQAPETSTNGIVGQPPMEEPKQATGTFSCPVCGASNRIGAAKCAYCDKQF